MYSLTKQYSTHSLRTKSFTEKYEIYVHGKEITFKCRCFYIFEHFVKLHATKGETRETRRERERERTKRVINLIILYNY